MLKISQKDSCSALFQWRKPDFLFFLSGVISDISGRTGVDALSVSLDSGDGKGAEFTLVFPSNQQAAI